MFDDSPKKVFIGNDVWIGMNVSIMGGITIGDGAIIGSHSLVTKNVEPYTIVGGVPSKKIKMRFDDEIISQLIASEWWNYPDFKILDKISIFNRKLDIEGCDHLINMKNENTK
jgi:virginiamycin A acetyltransferase